MIIDKLAPLSSPVVGRSDCPEPLLTCSVPNLQFDGFSVQLDSSDFEINPNCGNVRLCVGIVGEPGSVFLHIESK